MIKLAAVQQPEHILVGLFAMGATKGSKLSVVITRVVMMHVPIGRYKGLPPGVQPFYCNCLVDQIQELKPGDGQLIRSKLPVFIDPEIKFPAKETDWHYFKAIIEVREDGVYILAPKPAEEIIESTAEAEKATELVGAAY